MVNFSISAITYHFEGIKTGASVYSFISSSSSSSTVVIPQLAASVAPHSNRSVTFYDPFVFLNHSTYPPLEATS